MVAGLGADNSCEDRQGRGLLLELLCFIPE